MPGLLRDVAGGAGAFLTIPGAVVLSGYVVLAWRRLRGRELYR